MSIKVPKKTSNLSDVGEIAETAQPGPGIDTASRASLKKTVAISSEESAVIDMTKKKGTAISSKPKKG